MQLVSCDYCDLPVVDARKNGKKKKRQYCEVVIEAVSFVRGNEVLNPPSKGGDSRPPAARDSDTPGVGVLLLH